MLSIFKNITQLVNIIPLLSGGGILFAMLNSPLDEIDSTLVEKIEIELMGLGFLVLFHFGSPFWSVDEIPEGLNVKLTI